MASPDLDDGYLQISRELFDAECRVKMSGSEWQVYKFIQRKTFGFHKKTDMIAFSQFTISTGLERRRVIDAISGLVAKNMIVVTKNAPRTPNNYCIQKDFHKWVVVTKSAPRKNTTPLVTKSAKASALFGKSLVTKSAPTKETLTKEILQKKRPRKFTDDDLTVAEFIYQKILILNPSQKKPNFEIWANTVRLMRERDDRTHREICELYTWVNKHSFWKANVLSPITLRDKWDRLTIQKNNQQTNTGGQHANSGRLSAPDRVKQAQQERDRQRAQQRQREEREIDGEVLERKSH